MTNNPSLQNLPIPQTKRKPNGFSRIYIYNTYIYKYKNVQDKIISFALCLLHKSQQPKSWRNFKPQHCQEINWSLLWNMLVMTQHSLGKLCQNLKSIFHPPVGMCIEFVNGNPLEGNCLSFQKLRSKSRWSFSLIAKLHLNISFF